MYVFNIYSKLNNQEVEVQTLNTGISPNTCEDFYCYCYVLM